MKNVILDSFINLNLPLILINENDSCIFINDYFFNFFKIKANNCIEENIEKVLYENLPIKKLLSKIKNKKMYMNIEIENKIESFEIKTINITNSKNKFLVFSEIIENIDLDDKLEELIYFEKIFMETIPIPIFYMNKDGYYLGCNKAFENILGKKRIDIIGKTVYEIGSEELAVKDDNIDKEILKNGSNKIYESIIINSNGEVKNVIFHKSVFRNNKNEIIGIICAVLDVTELRLLNELKDKFFSIISHELRLPIGSASELLKYLLEDFTKTNKEELYIIIKEISKNFEAVNSLLENLLYWAKNQEGTLKVKKELVDIKKVLKEIVLMYKLTLNFKKQKLNQKYCKEDVIINIDKSMIATIVRNLISNAIKYTSEKGIIELKLMQNKSEIIIQIKDTGIGISKEKIENIFIHEYQFGEYGTNGERGNGFGLSLSKELVEKNNGKIYAESELGKGSKFIIKIKKDKK